jgi:hypothetical protein
LGDLGAFYTKITLLERIQERVSGVKHPQILKNFRLRRANPPNLENPLIEKGSTIRRVS